jgi:hypothetical protein
MNGMPVAMRGVQARKASGDIRSKMIAAAQGVIMRRIETVARFGGGHPVEMDGLHPVSLTHRREASIMASGQYLVAGHITANIPPAAVLEMDFPVALFRHGRKGGFRGSNGHILAGDRSLTACDRVTITRASMAFGPPSTSRPFLGGATSLLAAVPLTFRTAGTELGTANRAPAFFSIANIHSRGRRKRPDELTTGSGIVPTDRRMASGIKARHKGSVPELEVRLQ